MRNLILEKPICFFDLETTGVNPVIDKICSIAILKIYPGGEVEELIEFVNPGIPIPPDVSAIHGLTNELLQNDPPFSEIALKITNLFKGSDIAGFNSNTFDIPLLSAEFARVKIAFPDPNAKWIDVGNMYKKLKPRTLSAAYKEYLGKDHEGAHDSQSDNVATLHIFKRMLDTHEELPLTVKELAEYSDYNPNRVDIAGKFLSDKNGFYVYNFGKHRGEIIGVGNIGFLGWMLKNDFHPDTKAWARRIYDSIIPPNTPAIIK
jgi:DNA polymerase-3 subunit epsilon